MKVLTVKNPWAYLIVNGIKDVENRSRKTNYRGTILIHSSKIPQKKLRFSQGQWSSLGEDRVKVMNVGLLNNSAIIGQVDIVDCIQDSKSMWAIEDHWHWVLKNPIMYSKPIENIRGQLGIWNYYDLPVCQRCGEEGTFHYPFNLCEVCYDIFEQEFEMEVEMSARLEAKQLKDSSNK